jgi:hypothetical protein
MITMGNALPDLALALGRDAMPDRLGVGWLTRLLHPPGAVGGDISQPCYTVLEVKAASRRPAADARTSQIRRCLARLGGVDNAHQRLHRRPRVDGPDL